MKHENLVSRKVDKGQITIVKRLRRNRFGRLAFDIRSDEAITLET